MNLLIVDDEWYAVKGLSEGVDWADSGIGQVFTAFSVPAAKELVQSNEVNVVLLDIEMPGQNGLLLARWLQENPSEHQDPLPHRPCQLRTMPRKPCAPGPSITS